MKLLSRFKQLKKPTKIIIWTAVAILTLIVVVISFFMYDTYVGFGAPAHPGFAGYRPTVLPNNIKITGQSLTRQHIPGMDIWDFHYSLLLNSKDLTINENQKTDSAPDTVTCRGYGGFCAIHQTPKGRSYRIWYNNYNSKPFGLELSWTEGKTDINIQVNDSVIVKYLDYNWDQVFDSMQAVDLSHVSYKKYTSCGCGG
ncbi:MAG: hypothetical protein JWO47_938 [Candidatus Saccharibacteria bacterium]|nr:hypothetical protein [Candidatus Saccharibacteria bacterium]